MRAALVLGGFVLGMLVAAAVQPAHAAQTDLSDVVSAIQDVRRAIQDKDCGR